MAAAARKLWLPSKPYIIKPRPAEIIQFPKRIIRPRASVAVDSTGSETNFGTAALSQTYSGLTVGTGLSNSVAVFSVVGLNAASGNPGAFSATYNSVAVNFTFNFAPTNGAYRAAIFGVVAPASGTHNLVVTAATLAWGGSVQGTSFTGANQTGGTTTFAHQNSSDNGNSLTTSFSLAITTANGNYTYACAAMGAATTTGFTFTPGNIYVDATGFGNTNGATPAAAQNASTTTSTTYSISQSISDFVGIAGIDIVAAAGAVVDADASRLYRVQHPAWR